MSIELTSKVTVTSDECVQVELETYCEDIGEALGLIRLANAYRADPGAFA